MRQDPLLTRACHWFYHRIGLVSARYPRITITICVILTALLSVKLAYTPQQSSPDGYANDNARSRKEYKMFHDFLNSHGEGITVGILLRAQDNGSMIRMDPLKETVDIIDMVSEKFPVYDSDLNKNQSFSEFCSGFCQANDPVKAFYNGKILLESDENNTISARVNLSYPTANMFGRKFSLLPNFFGVELSNSQMISSSLIVLYYRAEKHAAWTKQMVKDWEKNIDEFFKNEYDQSLVEVLIFSPAIIERDILLAAHDLDPFIGLGFLTMTIFCSITTTLSAVALYNQKASVNKIILSVLACVNPFLACGFALGVLFHFGVQFSPILCITPFLVLAISVDDSFLMLHAWNIIEKKNKWSTKPKTRESMIAEVLIETGPAITISAFTNILAFSVGILTSPLEIRIFCMGNAACIFMDMLFQATFYTACMSLFADGQEHDEKDSQVFKSFKSGSRSILHTYVDAISNVLVSSTILFVWIIYLAGAIYGLTQIRIDLSSDKFFLESSPIVKIDKMRARDVIPFFHPATVIVNNPGNLSDPLVIHGLQDMRRSFEAMPGAIGEESTKFFLDDYLSFKESAEELDGEGESVDISTFLNWPEFSYWRGFISLGSDNKTVEKFIFTTGFHGAELREWSERGEILKRWRNQVDKYPQFNASVFTDDAFYLDILEQIPSITWQSTLATFLCMVVVCAFFMSDAFSVFAVSSAILSTCMGVFGYLSLLGVTLDPMLMSISIMCIGFSVDIPAHVSFHFYKAKSYTAKNSSTGLVVHAGRTTTEANTFRERLKHTLASVGFPVIQAGVSTDLCALPLAFVKFYMAQIFAFSMTLCVTLSLIHGLVIIPALFSVFDHFQQKISRRKIAQTQQN